MLIATAHPYTLQLPDFEGPLDLLLRLIEKQELAITTISLALVADQYLAHVRALSDPDPLTMAEFLALAAQLLLIKSRALLPRPDEAQPAGAEDLSGEELARRLQEYQQFKQAAAHLREWETSGHRMWGRAAPAPPPVSPAPVAMEPTEVTALVAAIQRRLRLLAPADATETVQLPRPKELTIVEVASRIHTALAAQPILAFADLLAITITRAEVIVTLWTVLELFKREVLTIEQPGLFEPISLAPGPRFGETWDIGGR